MTLEEAKKRIKQAAEESRRDYNTYMDDHVKGEEYGLRHALSILESVDTEPAPKDKMTLTELAHELRKIFNFRWLTLDENNGIDLWMCLADNDPPKFSGDYFLWCSESPKTWAICTIDFDEKFFAINLDFPEYKNENGEIDYSRCIVEVEG